MKIERSHLLFALMCLIWGATWVAVKAGIATVPPSLFASTRFIVAGAALLAFLGWRGEPLRVARADLPRLAVVTGLIVVATYSLLFWGARYVSSGLASILDLAFMPVALLTISAALREERLSPARACGVAVGVCGLLILFGPKVVSSSSAGNPMELLGGGALVLSALVYSLGSVLMRPLLRTYTPLLLAGVTMLAGGLVLLAGALLMEPGALQALSGHWGTPAWAAWAFLVLFGSLIAYTSYLHLVHAWGASRAGAYAFISPVAAVLLGVWVFGEAVTPLEGLGMLTMIAGAWLTLRACPRTRPERPTGARSLCSGAHARL